MPVFGVPDQFSMRRVLSLSCVVSLHLPQSNFAIGSTPETTLWMPTWLRMTQERQVSPFRTASVVVQAAASGLNALPRSCMQPVSLGFRWPFV